MNQKTKPIPDSYPGAVPYLSCADAARALEFYKTAFGATEVMRMPGPDGKIGHAEIRIGRAAVMLASEFPQMGFRSPQSLGGSPVNILIYVEDVDAFAARAIAAGAQVLRPVADQFYGDRSCTLADPSGHTWTFATHKEDVPPDELARRAAAMCGKP